MGAMDRVQYLRYGNANPGPGVASDMGFNGGGAGFYAGASGGAGVAGQAGVQLTGLAVLALTAAIVVAFYHLR